jgi:hypothetical protein
VVLRMRARSVNGAFSSLNALRRARALVIVKAERLVSVALNCAALPAVVTKRL